MSIVFFDGIGNQIYPPTTLPFYKIIDYLKDICNEHDIIQIDVKGASAYTNKLVKDLKDTFKTVKVKQI